MYFECFILLKILKILHLILRNREMTEKINTIWDKMYRDIVINKF